MDTMKWLKIFIIVIILVNGCSSDILTQKNANREKRASHRGQTQSQYLSFGGDDDGKAEAEATHTGSRATVYGKNGMGQAQSQSMGGDCTDCYVSGEEGGRSDFVKRPGKPGGTRPESIRRPGIPSQGPNIIPDTWSDARKPSGIHVGEVQRPGRWGEGSRPGEVISGGKQQPGGWSGDARPDREGIQQPGRWVGESRPGDVISGGNQQPGGWAGESKASGPFQGGTQQPGSWGGTLRPVGGTHQPGGPSQGETQQPRGWGGDSRPAEVSVGGSQQPGGRGGTLRPVGGTHHPGGPSQGETQQPRGWGGGSGPGEFRPGGTQQPRESGQGGLQQPGGWDRGSRPGGVIIGGTQQPGDPSLRGTEQPERWGGNARPGDVIIGGTQQTGDPSHAGRQQPGGWGGVAGPGEFRPGGTQQPIESSQGGLQQPEGWDRGSRPSGVIIGGTQQPGDPSLRGTEQPGRWGGNARPGDVIIGGTQQTGDPSHSGRQQPGGWSGGSRPGEVNVRGTQQSGGPSEGDTQQPGRWSGGARPGDIISGGTQHHGGTSEGDTPRGPFQGGKQQPGGWNRGGTFINQPTTDTTKPDEIRKPGGVNGVYATDHNGDPHFIPLPHGSDHSVINPGGLTVLVGTGGPRQTVIGGGQIDGPLRIVPSPQKVSGVSSQTVYAPSGGVTVLVGTGGPTQTVHHSSSSIQTSQDISKSRSDANDLSDIDNISAIDKKKYRDRGDQPGYIITPGQLGANGVKPETFSRDGKVNSGDTYYPSHAVKNEYHPLTPGSQIVDDNGRKILDGTVQPPIMKTENDGNRYFPNIAGTQSRPHGDGNIGSVYPITYGKERSDYPSGTGIHPTNKINGRGETSNYYPVSGGNNGDNFYYPRVPEKQVPSGREHGFLPSGTDGQRTYYSPDRGNGRGPITDYYPIPGAGIGDNLYYPRRPGQQVPHGSDYGFRPSGIDEQRRYYIPNSGIQTGRENVGSVKYPTSSSQPVGRGDGGEVYYTSGNMYPHGPKRPIDRGDYHLSEPDMRTTPWKDGNENTFSPTHGSGGYYPADSRKTYETGIPYPSGLPKSPLPVDGSRAFYIPGKDDRYYSSGPSNRGYYPSIPETIYRPSTTDSQDHGPSQYHPPTTVHSDGVYYQPGKNSQTVDNFGSYPSGEAPAVNEKNITKIKDSDVGAPDSLTEDDSFSQAESAIKGGEVSASAQGTKNGGTAQTQVSGTYTGKGSFSATAQTSDKDRSAQAQVSGGKEGAMTSSQGQGGSAKSQAQIAVDAKTGGTSATSQSGGSDHESQSEVVANEKGGLADAQSSGPGQTSSQAQIGFKPQEEDSAESVYNVFNGGGTASSQSGALTGQSQAQINGKFKFGISYHGAAQSASGTKEEVKKIRDKSKSLFRNIELFGKSNKKIEISHNDYDDPNKLRSRSSKTVTVTSSNPTLLSSPKIENTLKIEDEEDYDEDDDDLDEEDDEDYYSQPERYEAKSSKTMTTTEYPEELLETTAKNWNEDTTIRIFSQRTPTQKQVTTIINPDKNVRLVQTQNGRTIKYPPVFDSQKIDRSSGYEKSDSNPQDITISKTTQKIKYKTRYLPSKPSGDKNSIDNDNKQKLLKPDSYVSVTNSLSGSLNEKSKENGKFASTYFTKSSTCGHFTFSCNIVYGSEGRSRICRPKQDNQKC